MEKTLRDEIAIAALQGMLANQGIAVTAWETIMPDKQAKWAYDFADAMLAQRGNK